MAQIYTFSEWLQTRDQIWLRSRYDQGLHHEEERTISFGIELATIFKVVRKELVYRFSRETWFGNLIQQIRVNVTLVDNGTVIDVTFEGVRDEVGRFVDGVRRDIKDLYTMVDMVKTRFPIENEDKFLIMFDYFAKSDYKDLVGLNKKQLLKRVFYILSHPIFYDYEEIYSFIRLAYDLYRRNKRSFESDIQLNRDNNRIGDWAPSILNNQNTLNILAVCLRHGGDKLYNSYRREYDKPSSVVAYMRRQLRHRELIRGTAALKDVMTWMLYHLGDFGVLPKLHYELMTQLGQDDEKTRRLYGVSLTDLVSEVPLGLKYKISEGLARV